MCSTFPSNNTLCLTNSKTVYCFVCLFFFFFFFFVFVCFLICLFVAFFSLFFFFFFSCSFLTFVVVVVVVLVWFGLVWMASSFFPFFPTGVFVFFRRERGTGRLFCFFKLGCTPLFCLHFFSLFLSTALSIFFYFFLFGCCLFFLSFFLC